MKLPGFLVSCLALAACPSAVFAVTSTTKSLSISATVTASCSMDAVDLEFGELSVGMLPYDVTTSFIVTCTNTTLYSIGLNAGITPDASTTDRKLGGTNHSETLDYALYQDAARQINWGDASGTWMTGLTGTGSEVAHTIYGRVPDQDWPAPDDYSDIVRITVSY